jgi:four helix bundle protein
MRESILSSKSFDFALRIIKLSRYLQNTHCEYILSKQLLRSGTAVGALIREAQYAESKADFLHKLSISLKEINETRYWLELIFQSDYITDTMYKSIEPDSEELLKLLISSTKKVKQNAKK